MIASVIMASPETQNPNLQAVYTQPAPTPTPEWGTETVSLKEFSSKRQVPGFAKIVKGNYMTLGSNKFSFQKQHHEVFIHSVKVGVKVLAHCLRRVDASMGIARRLSHNVYMTQRLYAVDQRLAIPISYQGWFELLSEDGKSARPITSVHELSKVKPDRCLVRENMKAYLMSEDGKLTFDQSRIVLAGEQLVLNGELSLPTSDESKKVKLLRCFDSKGETIFLSFDQKGTFTPIAGIDDFAGVFNIRDVVRRFRLPLTVKLVQGVRPKVDPSRFTGLIRLDWVYTDETAFVCPIEKNHVRLLPVPTDANLQLVAATNQQAMKSTELYRAMMVKCNRMIMNYNNTLHLIVQPPEQTTKAKGRSNANMFSMPFQSETMGPSSARAKAKELRLMDDIDNLYAYVRDGGTPPTLKSKFTYDSDEESYWEEPAYEPLDEFRARLLALEAGERVSYPAKYRPQDPKKLVLDPDPELHRTTDSVYGVMNGSPKSSSAHDNKVVNNKQVPPPLPPRPPDLPAHPSPASSTRAMTSGQASDKKNNYDDDEDDLTPTNKVAPPIPSTKYTYDEQKNITTVSNLGLVSSSQSLISSNPRTPKPDPKANRSKTFHHSKSTGDAQRNRLAPPKTRVSPDSTSNSGSSGAGHRNHIARDFKDSDLSSMTRAGSSGSSGGAVTSARKKMQTLYL